MGLAAPDSRVILGMVLEGAFAKYHILEVIGEGGQGWVFKASYDDPDGFLVVVKVLRPDSLTTRDALSRFKREADILRKLSQVNPSPFIVRFYDAGEAQFPLPDAAESGERARLPYTVLEYVHGSTLTGVLDQQRGQGLAMKRGRRMLREVSRALDIVHGQGIVHRDLKPSNILIANDGGREVTKVTDFGLVKVIDFRATSTQSLAGVSLSYAPPEQYEPGNPRVGPHTDVFSFAAIVFEVLCGREAFPMNRSNPFEALRLISTSKRPKLGERPTTLPPGLRERNDLIGRLDVELERALDPEPGGRPATLAAFWTAIDPILREAEGRIEGEPSNVVGGQASASTQSGHGEPLALTRPSGDAATPRVPAAPPLSFGPGGPGPIVPAPIVVGEPSGTRPAPVAQPRAARPRDAFDPRAWSFRIRSPGAPSMVVQDATVDSEGRVVTLLTQTSIVQLAPGGATFVPLPVGMQPRDLRGLARLGGGGAHVFCGAHGLLSFLHAGALWDVRRFPDPDVTFHAVASDAAGSTAVAVGERTGRGSAFVAELTANGWRRTFDVHDQPPLRAVTFLDRTVFACGDGGALVRLDDAGLTRLGWERTGHLRAIAATRVPVTRVWAVGTGGHALSVAADPAASTVIEKVMTTQDLLGVCVDEEGVPWAVSHNARILRRDGGATWQRVSGDLPVHAHMLRIWATRDRVVVVAVEGTVLEGTRV